MSNENELLEPLATEAGQLAIVRAIRDISSLEYAVRAEQAASTASAKAGEASQSAIEASEAEDNAKDWATKTDTYVEQETITIPPEQEGEEPTTETINLYSARYYAALALDIYNNMSFDSVPTENSTNMVNSGVVYSALDLKADKINTYTKTEVDTLISTAVSNLVNSAPSTLDTLEELADALGDDPNFATTIATLLGLKADKSTTYTKTEIDIALGNVQSTLTFDSAPTQNSTNPVTSGGLYTAFLNVLGSLTFDNSPTLNSDNPVKSGGIYTALAGKLDALTFDNSPTVNSDNPVKSSGIKTALDGKQDTLTFDSTPTANSTNPVTSGGVYTALQNVNIDIDDEITEDSDNPVTSAAIYEALLNFTPSGGEGYELEEGEFIISESPIGTVIAYSGNIIPSDWLLCDGSAVSRTTYSELFAIIGTTYGIGDGSTTFNLPDLTDKFILGSDTFGTEKLAGLPNITGSITKVQFIGGCTSTGSFEKSDKLTSAAYSGNTDGAYQINFDASLSSPIYGNSTTVQPPAIEMKYIIRCKGGTNKILSEQMYNNVLYENSSGVYSGIITLNDDINNYDLFEFRWFTPGFLNNSYVTQYKSLNEINTSDKILIAGYDNDYAYLIKTSDTQLSFYLGNNFKLAKIIGIKLAKGGYSGIVSDARMTVKSGQIDTSSGINTGRHDYNVTFDSPMPDANYNILFQQYGFRDYYNLFEITITNKTVNGFSIATYQLGGNQPSLQDAHIDWIAIRPNSYTREGMVEDVLFSNASGVNSGTINLSGNISDYDLILFETNLKGYNNALNESSSTVLVSLLITLTDTTNMGKCLIVNSYDNTHIKVAYINDNTLSVVYYDRVYITKITGIKFGRYVSGVAVDTTVTLNSNAVVTSGAVYNALQNIPSGSSITVDSTITQGGTNPVEGGAIYTALGNKADQSTTYTKTEVDTALASKGDVTTNTDQNITGTKTFVGSKRVGFKQSSANDKLGFTLYGNTGTERGYLEFNPTNTVDGITGLMTLGNYATSAAGLTQVGFRRYSNISGASGAYNLLMPMVADARTPFSLTTTYQNFYLPLGFKNGSTIVKTDKSGVVDISSLLASLEARVAALEDN